jgi:hypothetical protein
MFSVPEGALDLRRTIVWWELRRIPFNLVIGVYGFLCLLLLYWGVQGSEDFAHGEDAVEPMALMAAPVVINLLYTLGWFVEIPTRVLFRKLSPAFGPILLKMGLGLGVFLCSLPAVVSAGNRLLR